jgi:hypothetical protein
VTLQDVNANYNYFTYMIKQEDIGDALVIGYAPAGDLAGAYLVSNYRRSVQH